MQTVSWLFRTSGRLNSLKVLQSCIRQKSFDKSVNIPLHIPLHLFMTFSDVSLDQPGLTQFIVVYNKLLE